jgi:thymidylate synthase (FAD)
MKTAEIEVTYKGHYGSDLDVVNAARVSFDKESEYGFDEEGFKKLYEADERLINYLAKHKHTSPFNHAFLSFRVTAPLFVAAQLKKHKFLPWNEVSRRYVDDNFEFYVPKDWRLQAENVKQGSSDETIWSIPNSKYYSFSTPIRDLVTEQAQRALDLYYDLVEKNNVAPEMARMVLPQNMMTSWIWSGTLGAFADMLRLRLDPHAQYESRIVAQLIHKEVEKLFPVSIKALLDASA